MEGKTIEYKGVLIAVFFDNSKKRLIKILNEKRENVFGSFSHAQLQEIRKIVFY